jgi:hypothetical protein
MFGLDVRVAFSRRRLLVAGLGAGIVAVPLGAAAWGLLSAQPAASGLRTLSESEARVVEAVAETYFPPGNPFGLAAGDVDVRGPVDAWISDMYPRERRGLRALLRGLERWPQLSGGGGAFTSLNVAQRAAVLHAFDESTIAERRTLAALLRQVCLLPLLENDIILAALGHRHGCALPVLTADDMGIG